MARSGPRATQADHQFRAVACRPAPPNAGILGPKRTRRRQHPRKQIHRCETQADAASQHPYERKLVVKPSLLVNTEEHRGISLKQRTAHAPRQGQGGKRAWPGKKAKVIRQQPWPSRPMFRRSERVLVRLVEPAVRQKQSKRRSARGLINLQTRAAHAEAVDRADAEHTSPCDSTELQSDPSLDVWSGKGVLRAPINDLTDAEPMPGPGEPQMHLRQHLHVERAAGHSRHLQAARRPAHRHRRTGLTVGNRAARCAAERFGKLDAETHQKTEGNRARPKLPPRSGCSAQRDSSEAVTAEGQGQALIRINSEALRVRDETWWRRTGRWASARRSRSASTPAPSSSSQARKKSTKSPGRGTPALGRGPCSKQPWPK